MVLRDFQARRQKGEIPGVMLLYGPEQGLIRQEVARICQVTLADEGEDGRLDITTFHASEAEPERLYTACRSRPFFLSHRLVHVKNLESATAGVREMLQTYLRQPARSTRLVLTAGDLEAANPLRKLCEGDATAWCVPFYTLEGDGFRQWLLERLRQDGLTLAPNLMPLLMERLAGDTLAAMGELDKLKLFMGEEREVREEHLLAVVGETAACNSFAMAEATFAGRPGEALRILERLLEAGDEPLVLLGLLSQRLRRLIQGKSLLNRGEAAKTVTTRLRIFWKEESAFLNQCRVWSEEALADGLLCCLEADAGLKGEGVSPAITLERLVMELAGKAKPPPR